MSLFHWLGHRVLLGVIVVCLTGLAYVAWEFLRETTPGQRATFQGHVGQGIDRVFVEVIGKNRGPKAATAVKRPIARWLRWSMLPIVAVSLTVLSLVFIATRFLTIR